MYDPVHDRLRVDAATEPGVPVLLAELGAEDGGSASVTGFRQLEQEPAEELVGPVEQPFVEHEDLVGGALADELPLAPGALPALAPEVLEVGRPHVARPHPPLARRLGERAGQVRLPGAGRSQDHDVLPALGVCLVKSSFLKWACASFGFGHETSSGSGAGTPLSS